MYILDKNKDFYDHHSYTYGIDKSITFDRRGSTIVDDSMIAGISYRHRYRIERSSSVTHILLEIGNTQYLIKLFNFVLDKHLYSVKKCSMKLVRIFNDLKHYFDSPMSIRGVEVTYRWNWRKSSKYIYNESFNETIKETLDDFAINLPILGKTQMTSFLDGQKIWIALQTYFSSLDNDKDINIPMTDVEKAENHGFDKKSSFRHPIK